jgi:hypothetical protein
LLRHVAPASELSLYISGQQLTGIGINASCTLPLLLRKVRWLSLHKAIVETTKKPL